MPRQTSKADKPQEAKVPNEPVTPAAPKYAVPKGEEDLYHVELSKNVFDPNTGKPVFKPFIQKYNIKMWHTIMDFLKRDGYVLNILHDPTKK